MSDIWNSIVNILKAPFVGNLDLVHLFVLVGIVLIFIAVWMLVLNHVRIAAAEV